MAVSRDTRVESRTEPLAGLLERLLSVSRYDFVLAVIPLVLLATTVATVVTAVPVQGGIAVASFAGALVMIDALFVHPPGGRDERAQ
jgi:hypothetical protein